MLSVLDVTGDAAYLVLKGTLLGRMYGTRMDPR